MEVIEFFCCSYVCLVADPSLTLNLKGLLVEGLVPRERGKHGIWSFSGWPSGAGSKGEAGASHTHHQDQRKHMDVRSFGVGFSQNH